MLKELKEHLEQAKNHGEKELPQWLREDERFRLLLRMLEKRVSAAGRLPVTSPVTPLQVPCRVQGWGGGLDFALQVFPLIFFL